ncbi:MAG: class I SAM-dependent methyltransferase [Pyrinomonadaceae bacterium]|nr:class I SAM-dependent methyltransferase [Pyrinomonadaceae bacterium]
MKKDTIGRFSDRVENYVKYRPEYPAEMLDVFRSELGLTGDSVIADIGSGPGISSKLFLENGNKVYGVEPNATMRAAAALYLNDFGSFVSVDGTSEKTTLDPESIDIIIAAQAFHWFDREATPREFRRILKKGGFCALIWNERQLTSNRFLREYESILVEFGIDYNEVRHENVTPEILEKVFGTPFKLEILANSQTLDFDGMLGRILSSSYMPSPEHPRFNELTEKLKSLFAEHQKSGKIQLLYNTNIFYTQF